MYNMDGHYYAILQNGPHSESGTGWPSARGRPVIADAIDINYMWNKLQPYLDPQLI